MTILIKNLSEDTHLSDIYHFVEPVLQRYFPFKPGHIAKTEILTILDKATHKAEFYGLVSVVPEEADPIIIRKLNGKRFLNKLVTVKEYIERDWHNDRRVDFAGVSEDVFKKRVAGRRRGQQIELIKDNAMNWE